MHVLISGAGIAGLTLAYCLQKAGIECTIVEKAPAARSEGFMIDFFGCGHDAAARMGLLPDMERIHYPISQWIFLDRKGRQKFLVPYASVRKLFDGRHFNLMRGDLECLLYSKAKDRVRIRFGTVIQSFEQDAAGVTAILSDRSTVRADLLVGADGVHSHVRSLAFGREDSFSHFLGCNTAAFILRDPPSSLQFSSFYTLSLPGRQVSVFPVRGGSLATFFVHNSPDPAGETPAREELRRVYGGMGWIIPRILERMEMADLYFDSVSQIEMPRWSVGRVALVGDACWCVSLLAGQGASLAMAGAYILAEELAAPGSGVADALMRYERRLRPHIARKQNTGRKMANWFVPKNRIYLAIRDSLTRLAMGPAALLMKHAVAPDSVLQRPRE